MSIIRKISELLPSTVSIESKRRFYDDDGAEVADFDVATADDLRYMASDDPGPEELMERKQKLEQALAVLTPRERDVIHMVSEGYTYSDIALKLGLSVRAVKTAITNVRKKARAL